MIIQTKYFTLLEIINTKKYYILIRSTNRSIELGMI